MDKSTLQRTLEVRLNDAYNSTKKRQAKGSCLDPVTVTIDELVELYHKQDGRCAALGIKLTPVEKKAGRYICNRWTTLSLDRIDNSKGYSIDNIRLTCWAANGMRGTLAIDESQAQATEFTEALTEVRSL